MKIFDDKLKNETNVKNQQKTYCCLTAFLGLGLCVCLGLLCLLGLGDVLGVFDLGGDFSVKIE